MNKKELAEFEAALTDAALRATSRVVADILPPNRYPELTVGWAPIASSSDYPRVEKACSSSIAHSIGSTTQTTTQRPISLYSSEILALRALRYMVEQDCKKRLRRIDKMIEVANQPTGE